MSDGGQVRTTHGRGRLFDSVLDTIGDTPCIRVNNIGPKLSFFAGATGGESSKPAGITADARCG